MESAIWVLHVLGLQRPYPSEVHFPCRRREPDKYSGCVWVAEVCFPALLGLSRSNRVVYGALNKRVVQGLFILTCISAAHRSLEERVSAVSFVALLEVFASAVV